MSREKKEYSLTRKDGLWMIVILLIYGIVSFINLGSMHNPQSFWSAQEGPKRVIIDLGGIEEVSKIRYYSGARLGSYKLYASTDNKRYDDIGELEVQKVFYWDDLELDETVRYLAIEPQDEEVVLGEVALYNKEGERLLLNSFQNAQILLDEQKTVPEEISYLNNTYFDEIYHARTAYEYLHGMEIYEWTHPPLGKLIMAIPISIMGMTPFAYRLMGNIAGLLMLIVIYIFAKRLFGSTRYAALAMLLFAVDGMHFVQTRIGTVDSFLVLFILCAYLFMYQYTCSKTEGPLNKKLMYLLLSGIFMGLAIATKWNGTYLAVGLAIIFFANLFIRIHQKKGYSNWQTQMKKIILWCFVFFIFIPILIYLASYIPFLITYEGENALAGLWDLQQRMYNYHSQLDATHPFSSPWYLWPIGIKPVWYYDGKVAEGMVSSIALHSNPLIWWAGIIAILFSLKEAVIERSRKYAFLLVALLAVYMPYALIPRIMYLYHYFLVVPLMILMLVGLIKELDEKLQKPIYIWYGAGATLVFAFFYPIYSGLLIPEWYAFLTEWLPAWQLY